MVITSPYGRAIQQTAVAYPVAVTTPSVPKPSIWETYRQALLPSTPERPSPMQSAVAGLRGNLEAAAISAALGAIHGKFGTLDIAGKYPVDGILAAVLFALSVRDAGKPDGFATDLRNMSQACTSVAVFRKTSAWTAPKTEENQNMSGHKQSSSEDPLVKRARELGLIAA